MSRRPAILALGLVVLSLGQGLRPISGLAAAPTDSTVITDSLYAALHPCLLFSPSEIPALQAKLTDGGRDDIAFLFIQAVALVVYPQNSIEDLLGFNENEIPDFGLEPIPNLGLAAHLSTPHDSDSEARGRILTLYIADNYGVDNDIFGSSLRLRALCLGFDMFMAGSTEAERDRVRDAIRAYTAFMLYKKQYGVWEWRPYLSNKTGMMAASMGLASIVLRGVADPGLLDMAMARADFLTDELFEYQWDEDGAAREGVLYGAWTLRQLIYYFEARRRYDGFDYAQNPKMRATERWLAYELDPAYRGRVNNIQDCTATDYPLSRHTTYLDWAQGRWQSRLAAYIWDQAATVPNGYEVGDKADKAATTLWGTGLATQHPDEVLPPSFLWEKRGLYYFRTGWPVGAVSPDVVLSFYAGRFEGGHQQEDQGQFTLTAFGHHFALDHGPGDTAKQSEAHNIVLIDDKGQHNAGSAIGTDAEITSWVIGDFADMVTCEAASAYTTYSELNAANTPYAGADWSWGYQGANPVNYARRTVVTVRPAGEDPYFIVSDDIEKDGQEHEYSWRFHTEEDLVIDTAHSPITVTASDAVLDVHVIHPRYSSVQPTVSTFDNGSIDPNSQVISLRSTAARFQFGAILMPRALASPPVDVARLVANAAQSVTTIARSGGVIDIVALNLSGGEIQVTALPVPFTTDARISVLRFRGTEVDGFALNDVTHLRIGDVDHVRVYDGPLDLSRSEDTIHLSRADADFVFFGPGVTGIFHHDEPVEFFERDGFLATSLAVGVGMHPMGAELRVSVFPNPLNPSSTLVIELEQSGEVRVEIYNARGQRVRRLFDARMGAGERAIRWDGRTDRGVATASGVYFARVTTSSAARSVKITVVR